MNSKIIVFIIILGLANFIIRFLPVTLLSKITLPKKVEDWLSYVPVATMAAIVVPTLLQHNEEVISISLSNLNLLSAIPTIIVAALTKSLALTLTTGIVTMAALQYFL